MTSAVNEVNLLSKIDSPYVIAYNESFIEDGFLNIIMEYAPFGTLEQLVTVFFFFFYVFFLKKQQKAKTYFTEDELWKMTLELCLGLYRL
jgi:serine/threonine protein kinase